MQRNRIGFLIAGLALWLSSNAAAEDLRDPRFMERAQSGFAHIFNLDYADARRVFASLEKEYPQHPAPPLYLADIKWLEELLRRQDLSLDRYISPAYFSRKTNHVMPPRERASFFANLQRCQTLTNEIIQRNPRDKEGRYFLAMTYGLRSSFAITIDHNLRQAFSSGNKSYSYARELIEEDPGYYDAYLAAGIYEYIVGSIPWYLRWMVFVLGARGSKQQGLKYLSLASEKSQYVQNEAKLVEMVLYVRESRFAEALEIARFLSSKFPRNFLYQLSVAQILQMAGRKEQAAATLVQVEQRAEAGEPNFDKLPLKTFRYSLGNDLMSLGRQDLAQEQFLKSIDDPQTPNREKALSYLRLGEILDLKGLRSEATEEYRKVLALSDVENSHQQAREYLKKPYRN
jgi:tetratricopeptide (TPR) repeat protein